jgi:glycosyltransferase involved in cell wall biosynthesis
MKYKKPVIVSNRGALPELIQDGYNGYVFDMEDEASLPAIFDKLDKAELRAMGKNAYCEYQNRFTASMMRDKMAKVYRHTLAGVHHSAIVLFCDDRFRGQR